MTHYAVSSEAADEGRQVTVVALPFEIYLLTRSTLAVGLIALAVLLVTILQDGLPWLDPMLFTNAPSANPDLAGARPAILAVLIDGSAVVCLICLRGFLYVWQPETSLVTAAGG